MHGLAGAHRSFPLASDLMLMHNGRMRTTVTLADETHEFATHYARARGISISAAIEELIQKAQAAPSLEPDIRRSASGLPMFPPTGKSIGPETIKKLEEEEFDPEKFA